jgi:thermosome
MGMNVGATLAGLPISILSKGYSRQTDVRKTNIMVAAVISEIVKTMLGPKGMDKMLVSATGDVVIATGGRQTLERLNVTHPVARVLVDVAKAQDEIEGDGTKTAVILAGELLRQAEKLLDQKIHPKIINDGYSQGIKKALEILDSLAVSVSFVDDMTLKKVAATTMGGRIAENMLDYFAGLVVAAIKLVAEEKTTGVSVNVDMVDVVKKAGGAISDSELIKGLIINKKKPHESMPSKVHDAKIALLGCSLDPLIRKNTDWSKDYAVKKPEQMEAFLEKEREFTGGIVEKIKCSGATVLFCRKRVSASILNQLAEERIVAFDLVPEKDILRLERATGGKVVFSVGDLSEKDLGSAGLVEFRKVAGDEMVFINGCRNAKAATILLRGGTDQVIDRLERVVAGCLKAVAAAVECGKVLPGGGAAEMEVAMKLRDFSRTFGGKEQLAVEAFAASMEVIPKTLAANAGLDCTDVLVELKAGHAFGREHFGVDAVECKLEDVMRKGLLDVYTVRQHALKAACEAAVAILRIDDIIAATDLKAIRVEQKLKERERKRVTDEKIRRVLAKDEELKSVNNSLIGRVSQSERA